MNDVRFCSRSDASCIAIYVDESRRMPGMLLDDCHASWSLLSPSEGRAIAAGDSEMMTR